MQTNVAARMTLAADPGSLQGAVAAGILGCGPVILGTSEACARLLEEAQERVAAGEAPETVAAEMAESACTPPASRLPGFGHPVHRPLDPRAERILELADERGVAGHTSRSPAPSATRRRDLGQAADAERLDADRGGDARSRLLLRRRQVGPDPRPHRRPTRPPGRGARAARSASSWRRGARRRSPTSRPATARLMLDARGRDPALGVAARRSTTRATAPTRLPGRALRLSTGRSWRRPVSTSTDAAGGLAEIARAAADRQAASSRETLHAGEPVRRAPLRRPRPRSSASTRPAAPPAPPATSRLPQATSTTGDRLGAQLRGLRRSRPASASSPPTTPARSRRARRSPPSSGSASPTSRSAPATPSCCCAAIELLRPDGGGADALLRRPLDRGGGGA